MYTMFAIIFAAIGGVLCYSGNTINNDMDAQMESFFNEGITNPGDNYFAIGVLMLVVAFFLMMLAFAKRYDEKNGLTQQDPVDNMLQEEEVLKLVCSNCGHSINSEAIFCPKCGEVVVQEKEQILFCPRCEKELSPDSKFCMYCGQEMPTRT